MNMKLASMGRLALRALGLSGLAAGLAQAWAVPATAIFPRARNPARNSTTKLPVAAPIEFAFSTRPSCTVSRSVRIGGKVALP